LCLPLAKLTQILRPRYSQNGQEKTTKRGGKEIDASWRRKKGFKILSKGSDRGAEVVSRKVNPKQPSQRKQVVLSRVGGAGSKKQNKQHTKKKKTPPNNTPKKKPTQNKPQDTENVYPG